MRPSNRQRKYSWETEEDDPQPRRRTPAEPADLGLPADLGFEEDPAPRTKAVSREGPRRVEKPRGRPRNAAKPKKSGRSGLLLRVGVFLVAVGAVGALALSGTLTIPGSPPDPPVQTAEAPPQEQPEPQPPATPPDFGSTFRDAGEPEPPADEAPVDETVQPPTQPAPAPIAPSAPPAEARRAPVSVPAEPVQPPANEVASAPARSLDEAPAPAVPDTATPVPLPRAVAPEEIAALRSRGKEMIEQGNIGQARLFLERAMRAEDPESTFLLAQTFDPEALASWGVLNMSTNPERAAKLYERARELGYEVPPS